LFHAGNYTRVDFGSSNHIDDLFEALEIVLGDQDAAVRLSAIWPLAWLQHPKATELLIQACQAVENQPLHTEIASIIKSLDSPAAKMLD
jgi:hypothetical protein